MSWTYSGNPGASKLDEVRFLIQDTDTTDQLLSNEEITYLLNQFANDAFGAAISAVTALIAQGSRVTEESKTVGDLSLSIKSGARVQQWQTLLATLKAEQFRRDPGAPVYNLNAFVPTEDRETEDESTDFVIGQMDNKT
jgi:hypothetical protein